MERRARHLAEPLRARSEVFQRQIILHGQVFARQAKAEIGPEGEVGNRNESNQGAALLDVLDPGSVVLPRHVETDGCPLTKAALIQAFAQLGGLADTLQRDVGSFAGKRQPDLEHRVDTAAGGQLAPGRAFAKILDRRHRRAGRDGAA